MQQPILTIDTEPNFVAKKVAKKSKSKASRHDYYLVPPKTKVGLVLNALEETDIAVEELLGCRLGEGDRQYILKIRKELWDITYRLETNLIKRYKKIGKNDEKT